MVDDRDAIGRQGRVTRDVYAGERDRACAGAGAGHGDMTVVVLPAPVGPKQPKHLAPADRQRNAVYGVERRAGITLDEPAATSGPHGRLADHEAPLTSRFRSQPG